MSTRREFFAVSAAAATGVVLGGLSATPCPPALAAVAPFDDFIIEGMASMPKLVPGYNRIWLETHENYRVTP
jgi:hypothetical protein